MRGGCGVLSFLILISTLVSPPVLACLRPFLAIHLMLMAAAVCGLSARREGCLLAPLYPCRAVSFVSDPDRFIPWLFD